MMQENKNSKAMLTVVIMMGLLLGFSSHVLAGDGHQEVKVVPEHRDVDQRVEVAPEPEVTEATEIAPETHNLTWLKAVESNYVCMVNNRRFDKPQIPVEVEGRTYYGCCAMCKAKLERTLALRNGTDPISGKTIDKSLALIGAGSGGEVYYFENKENMQKFDKEHTQH